MSDNHTQSDQNNSSEQQHEVETKKSLWKRFGIHALFASLFTVILIPFLLPIFREDITEPSIDIPTKSSYSTKFLQQQETFRNAKERLARDTSLTDSTRQALIDTLMIWQRMHKELGKETIISYDSMVGSHYKHELIQHLISEQNQLELRAGDQ